MYANPGSWTVIDNKDVMYISLLSSSHIVIRLMNIILLLCNLFFYIITFPELVGWRQAGGKSGLRIVQGCEGRHIKM